MFIPTAKEEFAKLKWDQADVIIISGDTYIDSPYDGASMIGKALISRGYKVGIIAQPDIESEQDFCRLGEPALFWGVTAGLVDSMVANYTALKKRKNDDDLTPGGLNNRRPDRAVIKYVNAIRRYFKNTVPIVIGGIEASLRRIAHYDYWDDSIRRSILFDSKADLLVYGMGEKTAIEIAAILSNTDIISSMKKMEMINGLRGTCHISNFKIDSYIELPSFETARADKRQFVEMFNTFYENNDPMNAKGLQQKHGDRYLIQNPPQIHPTTDELDTFYDLDWEYELHPYYRKFGKVKALETIRSSINTHRGCFGECNFCAITMHQGRKIQSRSEKSILKEAERIASMPGFKGYISDLGGPTANMYGMSCKKQDKKGSCKDKMCVFPEICPAMDINHTKISNIYKKVRELPKVKKVFVGSGLRYDLVIADKKGGERYLEDLVVHHVGGQLKLAPEHISPKVLSKMAKNSNETLVEFKKKFDNMSKQKGKNQFLTYYFIAAHPGCEENDMHELKRFINKELHLTPEQVQIFTPTPSTFSTVMYYTGIDPRNGEKVFVESDNSKKRRQKEIVVKKPDFNKKY